MLHLRSIALPLALALLGATASAPASACSIECELSKKHPCLWDEACNPRAFRPGLTAVRWNSLQPAAVRTFTRMDIEALRLFQRMP